MGIVRMLGGKRVKVQFGKDGKPLFISSPYDDAEHILDQLMRTAGEGNFSYMIGMAQPDEF